MPHWSVWKNARTTAHRKNICLACVSLGNTSLLWLATNLSLPASSAGSSSFGCKPAINRKRARETGPCAPIFAARERETYGNETVCLQYSVYISTKPVTLDITILNGLISAEISLELDNYCNQTSNVKYHWQIYGDLWEYYVLQSKLKVTSDLNFGIFVRQSKVVDEKHANKLEWKWKIAEIVSLLRKWNY